tara:strand:+ start:2721 stop:3350 length:630 start_codon:yes stop_codon:yes gene_type:complete
MLTKKQVELLDYITNFIKKNKISPSYEEMRDNLNLKSKSGIHRIISALEEREFIRRLPNRARAIELVRKPEDIINKTSINLNETIELPLYGKIAAGTPIEAISNTDSSITIPSNMINKGEYYALKISGDSMINKGINDNDTAIIRKTKLANNGEIVVALIDNEEATLKTFKKTNTNIVLYPANDLYESKSYNSSRIQIQGILVGIIRKY